MSVIVASWSNPNSIKGRTTALGIEFGTPAEERAGVPGRRMAWCYPFAPEDEDWIRAEAGNVEILPGSDLPADWRPPLEP